MSQTNTNANNGQNRNQNSERGGLGQWALNGSGRGNHRNGRGTTQSKDIHLKEKWKTIRFPN